MTLTAAAQRAAPDPIAVMVVDDSAVVRGLISREIEAQPDMTVASSAGNGEQALIELARHPADVLVLDIEMPVMDGLTALPRLLAQRPGLKVLIASTLTRRNAEISLKALGLGAADILPKPDGGSLATAEDFKRDLISKIRALGAARSKPDPAAPPAARPAPPTIRSSSRPAVIAIGGSTGAPPVLMKVFEALEPHVTQPILLTQHMPATFTAILAEQIARVSGRPVAEARDGEPVLPGRVYVAPGGWHMTVAREGVQGVIRLNQEPPENFCRPAVDPMLRSAAETYGAGLLAVILTGMGSDGALGCEAVARKGGRFVVQDEASSAVWGMPGAAAKTGLAEAVLPLDDIAPFLNRVAEPAR